MPQFVRRLLSFGLMARVQANVTPTVTVQLVLLAGCISRARLIAHQRDFVGTQTSTNEPYVQADVFRRRPQAKIFEIERCSPLPVIVTIEGGLANVRPWASPQISHVQSS